MNVISENGIIYSNAVGDKFKAWVDRQNELRQSGQPTAFDKAQNLYQNIQDIRNRGQQGFTPQQTPVFLPTSLPTQPPPPTGLSDGAKIGIAVGGIAVVGLIVYLIAKR